ncbi:MULTISPECIES: hypothetical protein [unclassified Streptomyces]|uniref:hypothetical protein n=1 Tax=unclassified Streptomyces TaxID=2593676 RepID=UPI0022B6EDCA|nr:MULTISPECIES: hypothetical protein [unclassified Streptomyces]MCZ7414025.1 hypothetical protein [Streptomyces sp. WMMC897]MCZ7431021.1 hypothetical protein [Streptomyces sp. WMMC1477]
MSDQHTDTNGEQSAAPGRHRGRAATAEDSGTPPHGRHRRPGDDGDGASAN